MSSTLNAVFCIKNCMYISAANSKYKKGNSEEHQPSHCSLSFEILSYIKYLDLIVTEIRRCVFSNPWVCVLNGNISVVIAHLHTYSSSKIKYLIKFVSIALIEYNVVDGVALSVPLHND